MAKPTAIAIPFELWERLVKTVKAGAVIDGVSARSVASYAAWCEETLEILRAAARDAGAPDSAA